MSDKLGDQIRIRHVIDAISEIENYTKDSSYKDFSENSMMQNACIRQLGIIGEACNRISDNIKAENTDIEWKAIIGLRNIVIHQYFGVDIHVIWEVIELELPKLKRQMVNLI